MKYRINYERVISQAASISAQADSLNAQIRALETLQTDCSSGWKGEAAEAFSAKLAAMHDNMVRSQKKMAGLANTVRYCAGRIQQEDRRAEELAEALSSGSVGGR